MNIVYAVTRNFYEKLFPSMKSLLEHNPEAAIYVLTEDERLPAFLLGDPTAINVSGQDFFPEGGPNYHNSFTYINLLKVCYASLLPVDRVIHLDADTIICDSLKPMWETDLTGKWIAACNERQGRYHPFGQDYYNMGVAVLNLKQMREDGIEPELVRYLNAFPQPWADQDAWNKYGLERDKFVELPVRYNENFATGQTDDPAIVHFCGIRNWWDNPNMPRREYLDKYMRHG